MGDGFATFGSFVGAFIFMLLIFVGAYYSTKLIGRRYLPTQTSASGMRVIDRLTLGKDHHLLIVDVGEKTLLLGVGPAHVEILTELDGDMYEEARQTPASETSFFSQLMQKRNKPGE